MFDGRRQYGSVPDVWAGRAGFVTGVLQFGVRDV
jgi:hypothetical protein